MGSEDVESRPVQVARTCVAVFQKDITQSYQHPLGHKETGELRKPAGAGFGM